MEDESQELSDDDKKIKILYSTDVCCVCSGCNDEKTIIVCKKCDMKYHLKCLNPPRQRRPFYSATGWKCAKCTSRPSSSSSSSEESEFDDDMQERIANRRSGRKKSTNFTIENDSDDEIDVRRKLRRQVKPVDRFVAGSASRKRRTRRRSSAETSTDDNGNYEKSNDLKKIIKDVSADESCSDKANNLPENNLSEPNSSLKKSSSNDEKISSKRVSLWKTESAADKDEDYFIPEKPLRKPKIKRVQYDSKHLQYAVETVSVGGMNVKVASKLFDDPRSSMQNRLRMRNMKRKLPEKSSYVEEEYEIIRVEDLD